MPHMQPGKDGRDLPKTKRTVWRAGNPEGEEVGWSIAVNHGGGYAFRLCPAGSAQTEACFRQHHLRFVGNTTVMRWLKCTDGYCVFNPHGAYNVTLPARDTDGTGGAWRRNPIPRHPDSTFPLPCKGCSGNFQVADFILIDRVAVPEGLAPGDYTLSWRWDVEENPQVWANCADVTVVAEWV